MVEERNRPTYEDLRDLKNIVNEQYIRVQKKIEDEVAGCCRQILMMNNMLFDQNLKLQEIHNYLWNTDAEYRRLCSIEKT